VGITKILVTTINQIIWDYIHVTWFRRIFRVSAAYHLFPTTVHPLKISDFSGENLKVFEVL